MIDSQWIIIKQSWGALIDSREYLYLGDQNILY